MKDTANPEYIARMKRSGTWAGEPEIIATARLFNVSLNIVTSSRDGELSSVMNEYLVEDSCNRPRLYLGHQYENHYISLGNYQLITLFIVQVPCAPNFTGEHTLGKITLTSAFLQSLIASDKKNLRLNKILLLITALINL